MTSMVRWKVLVALQNPNITWKSQFNLWCEVNEVLSQSGVFYVIYVFYVFYVFLTVTAISVQGWEYWPVSECIDALV